MGLSAGATAVIAQHHEHADGSGFPEKLNSDRMTMAARIVALVNRYDNLCNPHLLARAMTPHESLSLLFAQGRSKYDTSILGAFIKMMGVYPPGSMVQLTDDRYALVVAVNSTRPLKPSVLVHEPATPREEALVLDLESAAGLGIRRSVRAQQMPPTALDYLQPSTRVTYFFEPSGAATTTKNEQSAAGRPVQRRRGGAPHLARADRGDARGGVPGRARGSAHRRRQRCRGSAARRGAGRAGRPRHARQRADARGRVVLATRLRQGRLGRTSSPTRSSRAPAARRCRSSRRVSRIEPAPGNALYVVALYDRSEQMRIEEAAAVSTAELAATLESIADGVLVVDLAGHIRNFNRRFSALWELPEEMLLLRADDEVFDWMRNRVESPAAYMRRLAEIDADAMLRATDTVRLRSGALLERVTLPQLSRGRPIGRVFSYRLASAGAS